MKKNLVTPHLTVGYLIDKGISRDYQEDCIGVGNLYRDTLFASLAHQKGNLYVLADGAGGHEAGDIASELAVYRTLTFYYEQTNGNKEKLLLEAIKQASYQISNYAAKKGISEARATIVCALIQGNELYVVNVGDSRAYLIRNGQAVQLSQDHSLVSQWVREGKLKPEEAQNHAYRNVITQALGSKTEIKPTVHWEELLPGDEILLCSDGLHGDVNDAMIAKTVSRAVNPQEACEKLVDLANEAGGNDNISVIIINIDFLESEENDQSLQIASQVVPAFQKQASGVILHTQSNLPQNLKHQDKSQSFWERFIDLFKYG